jgi:hypothetical protein
MDSPSARGDNPRKSGSQKTLCWSETDSNFWSRERKYVPGNTSPARAEEAQLLGRPHCSPCEAGDRFGRKHGEGIALSVFKGRPSPTRADVGYLPSIAVCSA